jgi:transcriptional regulator of acetoin/glycerol metabolism
MSLLLQHNWPGNIRELKSAIDLATLHCKRSVINTEDLPPEILHSQHLQPLAVVTPY